MNSKISRKYDTIVMTILILIKNHLTSRMIRYSKKSFICNINAIHGSTGATLHEKNVCVCVRVQRWL